MKFKLKLELLFSKHSQLIHHICHNMAIEFIKVDLTDNLGTPWNISQNNVVPYAACMEKWTILFTHQNYEFSSKKPSATKHSPPSNVYYMEFYCNFLFQYSLIGIVKPKFFRRNEIWFWIRIWEIEDLSKNVRKKQDRTSLTWLSKIYMVYGWGFWQFSR